MRTASEIMTDLRDLPPRDRDEIRHWLDIHQDTQEIIELAVRLTQCYKIWWMLMDKQNVEKYRKVRNEYKDFFEPLAHVLLWEGFFVICAQIFDRDSRGYRSKHIHALIAEVRLNNPTLATTLEAEVNKAKPLLETVRSVRNKISAHRQAGVSPEQELKLIEPKMRDLGEALQFAQEIVCKIAEALSIATASDARQRISICQASTHNATFQVLEALDRDLQRPR